MAEKITDLTKIKKTQIQQKTEGGNIAIRTETEDDLVVTTSTNITGSNLKDILDNTIALQGSGKIAISSGGVISHTGSAATSTTSSATISPSSTFSVPTITTDSTGHITQVDTKTITLNSNIITSGQNLGSGKIILGTGGKTIVASAYSVKTDMTSSDNDSTTIPTSQAVRTAIETAITGGAEYLGVGTAFNTSTNQITGFSTPNSIGDWGRVGTQFTISGEAAHVGDIVICTGFDSTEKPTWDILHTEVNTNTWRPIQVNGTNALNDSNTTVNFKAGSNVSLSHSGGTITIASSYTDTKYTIGQADGATNTVSLYANGSSTAQNTVTINNVANATTASKVANSLTFNNSGSGAASGTTFNGSAAKTISYNTIGAAASSHTHGNITNNGTLQTSDVAIANGDKIVITDASNNIKVARSSITFDGTTTTKALAPNGTWQTFLKANQAITINSGTNSGGTSITGTASGTAPTLGDSGITAGTYSAIQVNSKGIAIAGAQAIKYYATADTIGNELVNGGFAFIEI